MLKDRAESSKDNQFYNLSMFDRKRRNYLKVNEYLGNISGQEVGSSKDKDPTEEYLKRMNDTI